MSDHKLLELIAIALVVLVLHAPIIAHELVRIRKALTEPPEVRDFAASEDVERFPGESHS